MSKSISIESQLDNSRIQTDIQTAKSSLLLKNLIEEFDEDVFVIPGIRGEILRMIHQFLVYMKDNGCSELPKPLPHLNFKELLSEWECNFMSKFDHKNIYELFEFINAVNYLDVRGLFEISCAKAASIIKDYDEERFMEVFQIEPDLNEEEYLNLLKQFLICKNDEFNKNQSIEADNEKELKKL